MKENFLLKKAQGEIFEELGDEDVGKNIENKNVLVFDKTIIDYILSKINTSDFFGGDY